MKKGEEENRIATDFSDIYTTTLNIIEKIKAVSYKYTSEEDFKKITDVSESQLIYWIEIIQRTHACATTSLQRLAKWLQSIDISWKNENYYSFCSSLRGLIEACSDTFHTSGRVCYTIAEHFAVIEKALQGEATKFSFAEELENELIHYIFARKLDASERATQPNSHKALQVTEYLNSLESDDIKKLYGELCQVSHPSMMSLIPFLTSNEEHSLLLHKQNIDKDLNKELLDRNREILLETLKIAITPPVCLLKLINRIKADVIDTLQIENDVIDFIESYKYWITVQKKIEKSNEELI